MLKQRKREIVRFDFKLMFYYYYDGWLIELLTDLHCVRITIVELKYNRFIRDIYTQLNSTDCKDKNCWDNDATFISYLEF